jgi:hypothetical protein
MRISTSGKVVITLALFLLPAGATPAAVADVNTQSTPAADTFKTQMDQYRLNRENYMNSMKQRSLQMKAINIAFKNSCDSATSDFKIAMSSAKSPDAKNSAISARKSAIASAIAVRDAAIIALGPEPVPPVEPARPMKSTKNKNR